MVFKRNKTINLIDTRPSKRAFCGNKGSGPFKKNFVRPKELANELNMKVTSGKLISSFASPLPSFGYNASVLNTMHRDVST